MKHLMAVSKASVLDDILCALTGDCEEDSCDANNQLDIFGKKCVTVADIS